MYYFVFVGRIRSTSDRTFRANDISNRYTWDQIITYDECEHAPLDPNDRNTMRLSVTRNFVVSEGSVVRFAMSNTVTAMSGQSSIIFQLHFPSSLLPSPPCLLFLSFSFPP